MKDFSYITNSHPSFIENLYQDYSKDPNSVDQELRKFFEGFDFAVSSGKAASNGSSNGQQAGVAPDAVQVVGVVRAVYPLGRVSQSDKAWVPAVEQAIHRSP